MEASARRLGAAHLSFSSFALSQGLAVRKFVKPLGESTESATAMPISEAAVSLIFRCVCPVPCTAASLVVLSIFIVHAMPIYPPRTVLRSWRLLHGRFRGPVWPLPSFWNFLAFADRVAVRTLLYSRGKDACGHVCACGLCAELPITVKGMG